MRTYSGLITNLRSNQIFVFGSNTQGKHGKGAALWALRNAGARYGIPKGLQGQSYAIITKDLTKSYLPNVERQIIRDQIVSMYDLASEALNYEFLIAYGEGPYLNGYTPHEMAKMFKHANMPDNIVFDENFAKLLI